MILLVAALCGPAAAETFRDCPDCPEMVPIEAGSFLMGASPEEAEWNVGEGAKPEWARWEQPRHEVRIASPFAVGLTEVTRGQFAAFVAATGHETSSSCWVHSDGKWRDVPGRDWRRPGYDQTDDHPVVCVSWADAKAYVRWLSARTGCSYRLPSEAEWEHVARAATSTMRYWGDDLGTRDACSHANVADLNGAKGVNWSTASLHVFQCEDGSVRTSPAASYQPNRFGLYDMLGNVWEWTEDCWNDSYEGAPRDGRAWLEGDCARRVVRGGSWNGRPRDVRAAKRNWDQIGYVNDNLGFRVVRSTEPVGPQARAGAARPPVLEPRSTERDAR
jgi:formylglycine-generating enzyme required for sulfatase activity